MLMSPRCRVSHQAESGDLISMMMTKRLDNHRVLLTYKMFDTGFCEGLHSSVFSNLLQSAPFSPLNNTRQPHAQCSFNVVTAVQRM